MQEKIDIQPHPSFKEGHELMIIELGLEEIIEGDGSAGSGHLNAAHTPLDEEDTDFVRGNGEVDLFVLAIGVALVAHEDAFIR